jgi:hypothetical protein
MSTRQSSSHAYQPAVLEPGELTLAAWLAGGNLAAPAQALQLITEIGSELGDAHRRGIRHGSLTVTEVVLSGCSGTSLGSPSLRGFAASAAAWPRREDIATDVAGLAGIAQALLLPAPPPSHGKRRPAVIPTPWAARTTAAVIGAGLDRREGVFLFESTMDFVVALESAVAADAGAPPTPDPALLALRQRRRRRRVLKVVTGAAVACLALLVVSNPMANRHPAAPIQPAAASHH